MDMPTVFTPLLPHDRQTLEKVLRIDAATLQHIAALSAFLAPHAEALAQQFYQRMEACAGSEGLRLPEGVENSTLLMEQIAAYIRRSGQDFNAPEYDEQRRRIGLTAYQYRISPRWLIAGFDVLQEVISHSAAQDESIPKAELNQRMIALRKVYSFDCVLAAEALHEASLNELGEKITALEDVRQQLSALANKDELTGILNRRALEADLERELTRAVRFQAPVSVLFFDIDRFKSVNDTYGHAAGDVVLQRLSAFVQEHLRDVDIFGRYGGEEFVIGLINCGEIVAHQIAERLRRRIEQLQIPLPNGENISITVSIGVAGIAPSTLPSVKQLIDAADTAMYQAKQSGRNAVRRATTVQGEPVQKHS